MRISLATISNAIDVGVAGATKQAVPGIVDTCLDALWDHPWFPFIAGGQVRLIETGMKPRAAWELSRKVLLEWVRSEGVKFGDPLYGWDAQGGREIVQECEIQYWDAAS